jgi:hypothetical protein
MNAETSVYAVKRTIVDNDEKVLGEMVAFWCPGCEGVHRVGVSGTIAGTETWEWNGKLDNTLTVSPSILCHGSVHICKDEHGPIVCDIPDSCGEMSHLILSQEPYILAHNSPHTQDPAWGPCHSFLRDGIWQFLGDSAHKLANQSVPMEPLPEWAVR